MMKKVLFALLFVLFSTALLTPFQNERFMIPRSLVLKGEFEKAFKVLLSYDEFNCIYRQDNTLEEYDYFILLLIASYRSGELEIAQKVISVLRKFNPEDADLCYIQGRILLHQKHPDKALSFFKMALAIDPVYTFAHYGQAEAYLDLGDPRKALAVCNYCIEAIDRDDPLIYHLKARCFEAMGKWKSAYRNMQIAASNPVIGLEKKRLLFENFYHKLKL